MTTTTKIRNQILRKIERMPEEQLTELDKFLKKLELEKTKKNKILSYAGAWKDMDDDIFREFTAELITRRQENKRRSDETSLD